MNHRLQALRIPGGWEVVYNEFYELDPEFLGVEDSAWEYFTEDILCIAAKRQKKENKKEKVNTVVLDLGWYPEMGRNGEFALYAIQNKNWETPLQTFRSRSRKKVVDRIESWLVKYSAPCYFI